MSDITVEVTSPNVTVANTQANVTIDIGRGLPGDPGVGVPPGGESGQVLAKNTVESFDTDWIDLPVPIIDHGALEGLDGDDHLQYHTDSRGDARYSQLSHTHSQSQSHDSPDTDTAPTSLHHTLGTGANQAAAGDHNHSGTYDPAGTASSAVTAHVAAADPHTQYLEVADLVAGTNVTLNKAGNVTTINSTGGGSGIPSSTIDAKGDLLAGTANDTVDRLAVGTNGQVLSADSSTSTGLKWIAAPSGGGSGGGSAAYTQDIGAVTANTPITVTHNLGTLDVIVEVIEKTTAASGAGAGLVVDPEIKVATTNTIELTFAETAAANKFRVIVSAGSGGGGGGATTLDGLTDVDTAGVRDGSFLKYSASSPPVWIGAPVATAEHGHDSTFVGSNVWDNNPSTKWSTGLPVPNIAWSSADFGAAKTVSQVFLLSSGDATTWDLQGSTDDSTWVTVGSALSAPLTPGAYHSFSPATYRYWRVYKGSSGDYKDLHSCTLYAPPATGWTAAVLDPMFSPVGTPSYADEFDGSALGAGWSEVHPSGGASRMVFTQAAGVLSARQEGGDGGSEIHCVLRSTGTFAVGDAIVTRLDQLGPSTTNYVLGGLVLSDSATHGSGNQTALEAYQNSTSVALRIDCTSFANFNAGGSATGGGGMWLPNRPVYLRLVRTATSTWRCEYGVDGVSWLTILSLTHTIEPTHMGVMASSAGTSTKGITSFSFFRRYAGVT